MIYISLPSRQLNGSVSSGCDSALNFGGKYATRVDVWNFSWETARGERFLLFTFLRIARHRWCYSSYKLRATPTRQSTTANDGEGDGV